MSAKTIESITGYELHPVCLLFPEMEEAELKELADDIEAHGQQQPVLTFDGKVIDGRNRLLACELAGIKPVVRPWTPFGDESLVGHVLALNLKRRHLTPAQRAAIGADAVPLFEEEAKD